MYMSVLTRKTKRWKRVRVVRERQKRREGEIRCIAYDVVMRAVGVAKNAVDHPITARVVGAVAATTDNLKHLLY